MAFWFHTGCIFKIFMDRNGFGNTDLVLVVDWFGSFIRICWIYHQTSCHPSYNWLQAWGWSSADPSYHLKTNNAIFQCLTLSVKVTQKCRCGSWTWFLAHPPGRNHFLFTLVAPPPRGLKHRSFLLQYRAAFHVSSLSLFTFTRHSPTTDRLSGQPPLP